MELVRSIISIGRYVREENKIKVRQPLSEALVDGKNKEILLDLTNLIKEELNVKEVGKIFGKNIGEYAAKLNELANEDIVKVQTGGTITLVVAGENYEITPNMVDIRYNAKEGFNVGMENGNFIILNTMLTDELKMEGNAREFVSKVQQIRKDKDFDIADRIITKYNASEEFKKAIESNCDYIKNETLSVELVFDESLDKNLTLNDFEVGIEVNRN